ncbi:beta strand repeat-containing protein [Bythopirellula polymerisocia]|uniref:Putative lipoprotein n=1 Tax=Bythopirellula polymerisocia TaxID=2528003 RepID=A0A5C6CYD7_9BACT|nr:hypothetical protein [Bythopirellula polymerisocia]TWU29953.1 putative lipoprotein [Bythopirellula polymerisocia]
MTRQCELLHVRAFSYSVLCALSFSLLTNSASGQGVSRSWIGGGATDNWFDSANWSPGAVPDPADFLVISFMDVAGLNTNNVDIANGGRIEVSTASVVTINFLNIGLDGEGTLDMSAGTLTTDTTAIAGDGNSFGTANITGSASLWNITDSTSSDLVVGSVGEGRLNLTNGAVVNVADDGTIGSSASGTGIVDVSGTATSLSFTGSSSNLIVGSSGRGTLNIFNGATVSNVSSTIASISNSLATVTVDSAGTWTNTSSMTVGNLGTGTLAIRGGGVVTSTSIGTIGNSSTGVGRVWVEGTDSLWDLTSTLEVGNFGRGEMEINGGGRVENTNGTIADEVGSIGSVSVRGNGSIWTNSGTLQVGDLGDATLLITDGGTVENTSGDIGDRAGSIGIVNVEGFGSTWTNSSAANIGYSGDGTLNIAGGATVTNTAANLGFASGSSGTVNVSGGGSHWNSTSSVRVGVSGSGTLNISGGATVSSTLVGIGVVGGGDVSIDGAGSRWIATSNGTSTVGEDGNASLQITSGGSFETPGDLIVAKNDASTSNLTVTGNGSRLDLGFVFSLGNVGGTATGSATIGTGAEANIGLVTVIQNTNSSLTIDGGSLTTPSLINNNGGTFTFKSGTVTIDGGAYSPGALTLNGVAGTATLNLQGSGSATIGEPIYIGTTGDAVLNITDGYSLSTGDAVTIGAFGEIKLDGGTLSADDFDNTSGGTFNFTSGTLVATGFVTVSSGLTIPSDGTLTGSPNVNTKVNGLTGSTITATGNMLLGDGASFLGFVHQGTLNVGNRAVNLRSAGFAQLGALTTLSGGSITAANGITLGGGDVLTGDGTLNAKIAAGIGSIIYAPGGDLTLGDPNAFDGFVSAGNMTVDADSIILLDRNQAQLGALTTVIGGGKVVAANGVVLDFASAITGDGEIETPNDPLRPTIINGTVEGTSSNLNIGFNGYVKGVGMLNNVYFTGTHAPGLSPTELSVGNLTYANSATLEIELGGLVAGSGHDQINSDGTVTLNGTLDVSLLNNFMPSIGDTFEIITATIVVDMFSVESLPAIGGLLWNVNYSATNVVLEVLSPFTADFDQDGDVDGHDFLVWQRDPNVGSLTDWQAQYGGALPLTASATSVPEPGTLTSLLWGLLALSSYCSQFTRRRRVHG